MKEQSGVFVYAILAGFCIGLGGTVNLRIKDAFAGGNVVGALLFTIGLFASAHAATICSRARRATYLTINRATLAALLLSG